MPLPGLVNVGEKDLLLPAGIHGATPGEVAALLVDTDPRYQRRVELWTLYLQFRTLLRGLVAVQHEYLDGSFVTSRAAPKDTDASFWVEASHIEALGPAQRMAFMTLWDQRMSVFRCDAYLVTPCAAGHSAYADYEFWKNRTEVSWPAYKNRAREIVPGVTKGYIEVVG